MLRITPLRSDDWQEWRQLRRQALREAPYAFGSTLSEWSGDGVALDVTEDNRPAIALYLRTGFVDVGWANGPDDPRPERRMILEL